MKTVFRDISKKSLQNRKDFVGLSLRTSREYTATKYILDSCSNSFGRSLVAHLHSCSRGWFAKLRGCALSVYTYVIRFLSLQCEPATRICSQTHKVCLLQRKSVRNSLSLFYFFPTRKSSDVSNHSRRTSYMLSFRYFVQPCMSF